jgi:hypothetical protein
VEAVIAAPPAWDLAVVEEVSGAAEVGVDRQLRVPCHGTRQTIYRESR